MRLIQGHIDLVNTFSLCVQKIAAAIIHFSMHHAMVVWAD